MKRAEFVVEAESPLGVIRGVNLACVEIEKNNPMGKAALPRHGVTVQWRVVDVVKPTDVSTGSLLAPGKPPAPVVAPNLPDISVMDIEEAKGIIGTAASREELEILEMVESSSKRFPGGRKGVLNFIGRRRAELEASSEKKAAEAEAKASGKAPKVDNSVLVMGGAVVEGQKTR